MVNPASALLRQLAGTANALRHNSKRVFSERQRRLDAHGWPYHPVRATALQNG